MVCLLNLGCILVKEYILFLRISLISWWKLLRSIGLGINLSIRINMIMLWRNWILMILLFLKGKGKNFLIDFKINMVILMLKLCFVLLLSNKIYKDLYFHLNCQILIVIWRHMIKLWPKNQKELPILTLKEVVIYNFKVNSSRLNKLLIN